MKSRVTTYVLGAAVLAVWGLIAWKMFFARPDRTAAPVRHAAVQAKQAVEEAGLSLDYKDPFLKDAGAPAKAVKPSAAAPKKAPAIPPAKAVRAKDTPPVKYTGMIKAGGKISYLFDYDGLQHALIPGEELAGYRLAGACPDSVKLIKNGETFTVEKQR